MRSHVGRRQTSRREPRRRLRDNARPTKHNRPGRHGEILTLERETAHPLSWCALAVAAPAPPLSASVGAVPLSVPLAPAAVGAPPAAGGDGWPSVFAINSEKRAIRVLVDASLHGFARVPVPTEFTPATAQFPFLTTSTGPPESPWQTPIPLV
jgi:hypothetical protein